VVPVDLSIGELARLSGVPVKTIRYYSDIGLLPADGRTGGGYRRFGAGATGRLAFIRTLRELGLGLDTIRGVLDQRSSLAEVATAHADALDSQIRILRLHRSVLRALAQREPTLQEVARMNDIARASAADRQRILDDFLGHVFGGLTVNPGFERMMRGVRTDLPDDPTPEQVDAWVELADLLADPDFRASVRGMAERHAADPDMVAGRTGARDGADMRALGNVVLEKAGGALSAGVDPTSRAAGPVVDGIVAAFAGSDAEAADPAFRAKLLATIESNTDERAERYWQLLGTINGWPPFPTAVPAWRWLEAALRG
jgi:DNA-binding transcriptional MerR regulator